MALTLPVLQPAGVTLGTMMSTGSMASRRSQCASPRCRCCPRVRQRPWGVAVRIAIVTAVSIVAFYYNDLYNNDLYNFEAPTTSASCSAVSAARSV